MTPDRRYCTVIIEEVCESTIFWHDIDLTLTLIFHPSRCIPHTPTSTALIVLLPWRSATNNTFVITLLQLVFGWLTVCSIIPRNLPAPYSACCGIQSWSICNHISDYCVLISGTRKLALCARGDICDEVAANYSRDVSSALDWFCRRNYTSSRILLL